MQVFPQQISPSENFDCFFYLRNPNDSATYYVRAVVYDVRTGAVLKTVNLTQATTNAHLYSATTQAPADPTGYGRNIVAVASVYTDSGYTSKSPDYEEQESYFLVKAVLPFAAGGGGVDYRVLREMMQEEITKAVKAIPKPDPVSLDGVYGAIGALQREINRIPKELPEADNQAIIDAIAGIRQQIESLPPIPETKEPDLAPILERIDQLVSSLSDMRTDSFFEADQTREQLKATIIQKLDELKTGLTDDLTSTIEKQEFSFPIQRSRRKDQPTAPTDPMASIGHLMGV